MANNSSVFIFLCGATIFLVVVSLIVARDSRQIVSKLSGEVPRKFYGALAPSKKPNEGCRQEVPVPVYNSGAVQGERGYKLRRACRRNNLTKVPASCFAFDIFKKYELLVSFNPKCGGSTWTRLMMSVLGYHNITEKLDPVPTNNEYHKVVPRLRLLKADKRKLYMANYRMVLFVRNPFVRLLSGFRDRLEEFPNDAPGSRKTHNKKIYLKYGNHSKEEMPDPSTPSVMYNVTFKEFVNYFLAKNDDVHWREQYKLCHPCLGYDFIGKVETYNQDVAQVLHMIGVDPKFIPDAPMNPTGSKNEETLARYYSTLTDEQYKGVVERFKIDMEYFDYSIPEVIRRSHIET